MSLSGHGHSIPDLAVGANLQSVYITHDQYFQEWNEHSNSSL